VQIATNKEKTMMDELINKVAEKTGLSPEQAKSAVEAVIGFLKEKLPAPLAGELDNLVGGGAGSGNEALASAASAVLGDLFGKR
jgi:hypothetical protein